MKVIASIFILTALIAVTEVTGAFISNANHTLKRQKRLSINGNKNDANFDEFRFTVSVENWSEFFRGRFCNYGYHICGGSILTPKFVLTAAHCVERKWYDLPRKLKVRAGSPKKGDGGSLHDIVRFIEHENYRKTPLGFDIAILKLKTDIDVIHSHAREIQMVDNNNFLLHPNVEVKTAGWGRLRDETFPEHLQSLEFRIVKFAECNGQFGDFVTQAVTGEFCAQSDRGEIRDGDSGGPVITRVGNVYRLAGIVIRGKGTFPGVFTDVWHYREWITERIR